MGKKGNLGSPAREGPFGFNWKIFFRGEKSARGSTKTKTHTQFFQHNTQPVVRFLAILSLAQSRDLITVIFPCITTNVIITSLTDMALFDKHNGRLYVLLPFLQKVPLREKKRERGKNKKRVGGTRDQGGKPVE